MTNSRPTEGVRMTARMPDKLSRNVSRLRAEAASSLTTTAINRPIANVTAATPRKLPRQPIVAVEKGERSRRQECSQRSDPDLQAGERGKAIRRKSPSVDGKRGHERARRSQPQQRSAEDQNPGTCGACEHNGADDRDRCADHETNARAESVERHAERNLDGGERQKEDARQETDLGR